MVGVVRLFGINERAFLSGAARRWGALLCGATGIRIRILSPTAPTGFNCWCLPLADNSPRQMDG